MPSSEPSQTVLDPDGEKEADIEPLSLLISTKAELENYLQRALSGGVQEPPVANMVAEKVVNSMKTLRDPSVSDHDEFISVLQKFFEVVAVLADLFENLRSNTSDDVKSLNNALDECIARCERMVALDFKLSLDERFEEMTDSVLKICFARQTHSKRNYVALIKIHNRLLEKVDEPILRQSHVASLVHSMGEEVLSSLESEGDQNWKLVAFLVKRIVFISSKCGFCSDDPKYIGTITKLYGLRLSDHPLNKLIEKIELWKLVDFEGLRTTASGNLGIGFVLLCCDSSEHMLRSQENRAGLEFCIRAIFHHASDIVKFMFHRIGTRPVFDHCLHILCRGLVSIGTASILDEISLENISLEQRLLHDEACRYFSRREIVRFDPCDNLASLGYDHPRERSKKELQSFFDKAFENTPMIPIGSSLKYNRIKPCSPNSALLFSLISTLASLTPSEIRPMSDFLAETAELLEILTANPENDCLFLCACTFFTAARDFALGDVEDLSKQAPIVKLKGIVSRLTHNAVLNGFGATSLIIFTFGTDLPRWLSLRCPSHEDYFRWFELRFDFDRWNSTLRFLKTDDISSRPINVYSESQKPTTDPLNPLAPPETVTKQHPSLIIQLYTCIDRLESNRETPTAEETQILKRCIEKLEKILERSSHR